MPKPRSKKRIMREFVLDEISMVDRPAQEGATFAVLKRADDNPLFDVIAKAMEQGAMTFNEILDYKEECKRQWEAQEALWPLFGSLQESINSIVGDESVRWEQKLASIRTSVDQFQAAVRDKFPEIEEELTKVVKEYLESTDSDELNEEGDDDMPPKKDDLSKTDDQTLEDLKKQVETLTAKSEELSSKAEELEAARKEAEEKAEAAEQAKAEAEAIAAMPADEKEFHDSLPDAEKKAFRESDSKARKALMKARADDDEVIKVEGREIRKSVVGEDHFEIMKAQQARFERQEAELRKEREEREAVQYAKRADEELEHLPGETVEKAKVLKAIDGMDEETRKTLNEMLKAGDKAIKSAYDSLGTRQTNKSGENGPDGSEFMKKVEEIKKSGRYTHTEAMQKAREDYPEEFAAYQNVPTN